MGGSSCTRHKSYDRECGECRTVNTQRKRERRERLRGAPVPEGLHGREGTFEDYGCRCGPCTYAHRDATHKRYSRGALRRKAEVA